MGCYNSLVSSSNDAGEETEAMKKFNASKIIGAAMLAAVMVTSVGCYPYWWRDHNYNRRDDYRRSDRYDWRRDNDRWDYDRYR